MLISQIGTYAGNNDSKPGNEHVRLRIIRIGDVGVGKLLVASVQGEKPLDSKSEEYSRLSITLPFKYSTSKEKIRPVLGLE